MSKNYWCNVSRGSMEELNKKAKNDNWHDVAEELIPEYIDHLDAFNRADFQFLLPITSESRVLDAGCMWGGVAVPVSQYCDKVFAVDKTNETLSFLKINYLPFPDNYFDVVILDGVLEWVAFDQEVILEEQWGKKRTDYVTYSKSPREVQIEVLKELNRVLKNNGVLCIGIENSIGYQYLAGYPDDHVNLKYVSFLPRFFANYITKKKLNCEYRTYIYSLKGYRSLLQDSGFDNIEFYGAFPHYIAPTEIIPLEYIKYWKNKVLPTNSPFSSEYVKKISKIFPSVLLKYFYLSISLQVFLSSEREVVIPSQE